MTDKHNEPNRPFNWAITWSAVIAFVTMVGGGVAAYSDIKAADREHEERLNRHGADIQMLRTETKEIRSEVRDELRELRKEITQLRADLMRR